GGREHARPADRQRRHPGDRQWLHQSGHGARDRPRRGRSGRGRTASRRSAGDRRCAGARARHAAPARHRATTPDRSGGHRRGLPADARGSRSRDRPCRGHVDRGDRRRARGHARDGQGPDPRGLRQGRRALACRPGPHAARDAFLRPGWSPRRKGRLAPRTPLRLPSIGLPLFFAVRVGTLPSHYRRHQRRTPLFRAFFLNRRWFAWSIAGTVLILFATWYKVELDVAINEWFGDFYNLIQKALGQANSVTMAEYGEKLFTFGRIAGLYILIAVVLDFFIKHYIFRWRTAMNDFYMANWHKVRHIEGASQRVQEDTMRFARIMEGLGVSLMRSLMTLAAFLPILWTLSGHVTELP